MAQCDYLFALCSDAVCVAEESTVAFFSPKTLKKFRVETFSGARICGLYIQPTRHGNLLHVIDADFNYHVMSLKKVVMEHSTCLTLVKNQASKMSGNSISTPTEAPVVLMVQFYEREDALRGIIMTKTGGCDVLLTAKALPEGSGNSSHDGQLCHTIPYAGQHLDNFTFSVGRYTGLVVIAKKGSRQIRYSSYEERCGASEEAGAGLLHERNVSVEVHRVICSPRGERVAIGSTRGELVVYPSVKESHYFSDHWHHTPLSALCFSLDGTSLVTGAQEEVLLVWNISSFSHRKIRKSGLGPVRCIVPCSSTGSTMLVASSFSTLSMVDLLQMTVEQNVAGIEWSSGEACTGCFFTQWMGQTVVALTGLPNVLRLVDPLTHQSVHSLHVSSQMETVPIPPGHGIELAAVFKGGSTIVTYENFKSTVLAPQLSFWAFDTTQRAYVRVQTIYSPHDDNLIALSIDEKGNRLFTLSHDTMKCWEEVVENPTDAVAMGIHRTWRNQSSSPTPSRGTQSMLLSSDGSLCFVADDSVHVYSVQRCQPGVQWPRIMVLSQHSSLSSLLDLQLFSEIRVLCSRTDTHIFAWRLSRADPTLFECPPDGKALITAMTHCGQDRLLIARKDCSITEVKVHPEKGFMVARRWKMATAHPVKFVRPMPLRKGHFGVIDEVSGFRLLVLEAKKSVEEASFINSKSSNADGEAVPAPQHFSQWFQSDTSSTDLSSMNKNNGFWKENESGQANRWLRHVLQDAPYTAPPMSALLSQYLSKRDGPA